MDKDKRSLVVVIFAAMVMGLVYVFAMPPWQHYDEPQHFEYAWWIAEKGRLPKPADVDLTMRRNVAASMVEYHFYDNLPYQPDLSNTQNPILIGPAPQLTNPPFYYLLASLPMKLLPPEAVLQQLYAARLVSWLLYLLSLLAIWGLSVEVAPSAHWLHFLLPLSVAFLPGYLDIMTAVNNDVGAITLASFCLWGCARLMRRGFCWYALLGMLLSAALIFWTKETAYFMILVTGVTLWLLVWPSAWRWIARLALVIASLAAFFILISWDDAAYWYRSSAQAASTRLASPQAAVGGAVFQIDTSAVNTPNWLPALAQPIYRQPLISDQDRIYTLGAWVWADRPMKVFSPILALGPADFQKQVTVGQQPVFVAVRAELPSHESQTMRVILQPTRMGNPDGGSVYYDGIVVVEGEWPLDQPPVFSDEQGEVGTWGGASFQNLLRNGSAETPGPRFIPRLDDLGARFLPDNNRPSLILASFLDGSNIMKYDYPSLSRLFRTFWGQFGWGNVNLTGHKPYRLLLAATFCGLVFTAVWFIGWLFRGKGRIPWDLLIVFGLALLGAWGVTTLRGISYIVLPRLYLPVARYALPAIFPTVLPLVAGWSVGVVRWFGKYPRLRFIPILLQAGFLIILQVWSIFSILSFYPR